MQRRNPHPVDVHVGARVRMRRVLLKMSQERLGDRLGLTFQQIQKYEKGHNRIGASRLWAIAEILNVPISYFYEELVVHPGQATGMSDRLQIDYVNEFTRSREGMRLMKAFMQIKERDVRRSIVQLTCSIAGGD